MSEILVKKPGQGELDKLGVRSWPIWEKEASRFDWYYDDKETCYLLKGKVTVTTNDGKAVSFGAGDLVVFSQGLSCNWHIEEAVEKHYNFG